MAIKNTKNQKLTEESKADSEYKKLCKSFAKKVRTEIRLKGIRAAELTLDYYTNQTDVTYNEKALGLKRDAIKGIYQFEINDHYDKIKIKRQLQSAR